METIIDELDGKRRVLTEGSFVYFFEKNQQFTNMYSQGFIEKFHLEDQEVTVRTVDGRIITKVSLHRVYL